MTSYRDVSLWFDQLAEPVRPGPALCGVTDADVAIVGAGFTGLWTAYYLLERDPSLRVVVVEAEVAGFGASGRNGGWCSALYPVGVAALAAEVGPEAAVGQYAAMRESVGEVARVVAAEDIDADLALGGTVVLARGAAQLRRAQLEAAESREFGLGVELLDAAAARARVGATDVLGATYTPHCAAIQPAKLVRGLAGVVRSRGVRLFERSRVRAIEPGLLRTDHGSVRAGVVIRATEGFTARLPGLRREITPIYSLIIATAPLPASLWDEIGLGSRETFSDHRHLVVYGQRTADDRMIFGGRGAPYHLGSRISPAYDQAPRVFRALQRALSDLFPALAASQVTHRWGGPLGVTRDWHASVGLDPATGLAWAGGYVGDGVSTANLAGRTLADLITGTGSALTRLPWVGHRSPKWEPEPLRWLGANSALRAMTWADRAERRTGRPSRLADLVNATMGR
ncbi:MAG: FAD-binding oxidoreductase [Actinomycetota bacterium]|nr:FAD-binding oxidoreductase [Actinomycetota bacterium]